MEMSALNNNEGYGIYSPDSHKFASSPRMLTADDC